MPNFIRQKFYLVEKVQNSVEFVDDKGAKITDIERGKINRISKIYSLGNMTLIRSRLNSSIRNYPLKRKIEGEGRKRGLSSYAELTITKHDIETIDKSSCYCARKFDLHIDSDVVSYYIRKTKRVN